MGDTERMLEDLREAAAVLVQVGKRAIVVRPTLDQPYADAPDTTPWKKFMEEPARNAYNLGVALRARYGKAPDA